MINNLKLETGPKTIITPGYPDGFYSKTGYCHPDKWLGQLIGENGERLNKNIRKKYYPKENTPHIAKTPLHAIRYAISQYTKEEDWVLDPFAGSGTTGVEALIQGRNFTGVEYEFADITRVTLEHFDPHHKCHSIIEGDASKMLSTIKQKFRLVNFSNPYPDGGDHSTGVRGSNVQEYKKDGSAGLMKSSQAYWELMKDIQGQCCELLLPGGYAVFVIKDMMKNKKVWELHKLLADLLPDYMEHVGTFALDHYPRSLSMNTYEKRWGVRPPLEQVCPVFKKKA